MKQKFICLALLICTINLTAFAQPAVKHQKTIGGSAADICFALCLTKDGGFIAGGSSYSNMSYEKTENRRGGQNDDDYWIVKLNSRGNIEWDKTIGGNEQDMLTSLEQTSDGGYILGGYSSSDISGEKTENRRGTFFYSDYWIVKLDSLGNIQWDKTIGGGNRDDLQSLQQTSDGGYILGGSSYSDKSFEKTENSRGIDDYWIVKLDSLGNIQWDKTIGGNRDDNFNSLRQTIDGGYILGGGSGSNISGEKTQRCRGFDDYWIVKLDGLGNIQWDKTIGGGFDDKLTSVRQINDRGYILGGFSSSNASYEKTENNRCGCINDFSYDYWVVKLYSSGNIQWDKTIGGSETDLLYSVEQSADGGYILGGGSFSDISGEKTESNRGTHDLPTTDYWVVKLNDQGKFQWDKTIGGEGMDDMNSIKEIEKNTYILGGYSSSKISGDKIQADRGGFDYWLVELKYTKQDSLTVSALPNANSLKSDDNYTDQFLAFPNPAKEILNIQINGKATFTLTNQSGKILLTQNINNKGKINIAHLPAGLYYLKNTVSGIVQKIIISK